MTRNHYTIGAWTVDVAFIYRDGDYHLKPVDDGRDELACCTLYADIEALGGDDYRISGIYLKDNFSSNQTLLDGWRGEEARAILLGDKQWREWASAEAAAITGYEEGAYDAPVTL